MGNLSCGVLLVWMLLSASLMTCQRDQPHAQNPAAAVPVSYYQDIKPLIDGRCIGCHAQGQIGFSLEDYDRVTEKRSALVRAIESRRMPIWLAARGHQHYKDDPTFSEAEIQLVQEWAAQGFPEGNREGSSKPQGGANLLDLDADLALNVLPEGETYLPNQTKSDEYRCFLVEWPFADQDKYMVGFQAKPQNRRVTHHLVAYMLRPAVVQMAREMDAEEKGLGYECLGGALPDRLGDPEVRERMKKKYPDAFQNHASAADWIGHWAPGMKGNLFADGTGLMIRKGSYLVIQVHYYTVTAPNTADPGSEVRFKLSDAVDRPGFILPLSNDDWLSGAANRSLVIPSGQESTVTHEMPFTKILAHAKRKTGMTEIAGLEIQSANLHMHSYGKSGEAYLIHGDSETKNVLLEIPNWKLNWQRDFNFAEPIRLAIEDISQYKMGVRCTFTNKTDKDVFGGYGSDDEMCFNFSFITVIPSR